MTLILTLVASNKVIQVSDRLLTLNGEPRDYNATKDIAVGCDDALFCTGYTGVAEVANQRMDYWLLDRISDMFASGQSDVLSIAKSLGREAELAISTLTFRGTSVDWRFRGLTFVLAGFANRHSLRVPFTARISNIDARTLQATSAFARNMLAYRPNAPPSKQYLYVDGMRLAFTASDSAAASLRKQYWQTARMLRRIDLGYRPEAETTVNRLVWLIRQASRHPKYGRYIGRDCSSSVIHPDSDEIPSDYYPEHEATVHYLPHLVTPMMTMWGVEVDLDPELPSE